MSEAAPFRKREVGRSMIGMVLVTHGRLAVEFVAALEHVVGKQERIAAVCIGPEDDMEARRSEIAAIDAEQTALESPLLGDPDGEAHTNPPAAASRARIATPLDIGSIQRNDPVAASRWRALTREAFERCLAAGFRVQGFKLDRATKRAFYLLVRDA